MAFENATGKKFAAANNRQGTTQLSAKGSEDLGGGLTASFNIEQDFVSVNNAGLTGGEAFVGLAGSFGSIKLGAPNTPTLSSQASRQPFGTKLGGGFSGALGTGHVRNSGSFVYAAPAMGGVTVALGYTPETTAAKAITDLGLTYASGALKVLFTQYKQATTQNNLAVQYDLGAAVVYAGASNETGKDSSSNLAVKVPMGALSLLGNYATMGDDKTTAVGVSYALSKRTSTYARYVDVKASGASTKTTLVGVQHNF